MFIHIIKYELMLYIAKPGNKNNLGHAKQGASNGKEDKNFLEFTTI